MTATAHLYSQLGTLLAWRFQLKRFKLTAQQKLVASKGGISKPFEKVVVWRF